MDEQTKRQEQLKDRRDYRATLIHRREQIERKINATEKQIAALTKP